MRVRVEPAGGIGLVADIADTEPAPAAWTAVDNVRFRRGKAEPMLGYTVAYTATGVAHYLVGVDVAGTWKMWYPTDVNGDGTAEEIYEWDGTNETKRTRATNYTAAASQWNGCVLHGVPVLNNYSIAPQYKTASATTFADLVWDLTTSASSTARALTWSNTDGSSATYRAKVIRPFKNFLFALYISQGGVEYPYAVHWSNPSDPGTVPDSWDYANPENESGRTDLSDSPGFVVDALALRDTMVIYKEDAIWLASYIGGAFVFNFQRLTEGYGLYGQGCAVDIGGRHICLGDGVAYVHDGHTIENILEGRAADDLFESIDPTYYNLTFLAHNRPMREVWICYPSIGSTAPDRAFVYSYEYNVWSRRQLPAVRHANLGFISGSAASWPTASATDSWDDDMARSWDARAYRPTADTLIGVGTNLWKLDDGNVYNGVAPTVTLERTGLRLRDGGGMTMCRAIYPRMQGEPVSVQVGAQLVLDGSVDWSAPQSFDPGADTKVDVRVTGEALAVRFSSSDGAHWHLSGYELDVEPAGER